MPGPSYTREFGYNEEAQPLSISHSGTLAYQYAYGADGKRRWAKDIANNAWTWYPCGVACGAGELVEQGSDPTGGTWTTNAQYLRAGGGCSSMLTRRKSSTDDEYHREEVLGVFGVITGVTGAVMSSNLNDKFGGLRQLEGLPATSSRIPRLAIISVAMGFASGTVWDFNRACLTIAKIASLGCTPGERENRTLVVCRGCLIKLCRMIHYSDNWPGDALCMCYVCWPFWNPF